MKKHILKMAMVSIVLAAGIVATPQAIVQDVAVVSEAADTLTISGPTSIKKGASASFMAVCPHSVNITGWKSSNTSVLTVTAGGRLKTSAVVVGKKAGKATITCTYNNGKKATFVVKVVK